ncbi:hypothetical protein GCM10027051_08580 [Niabella terrae]
MSYSESLEKIKAARQSRDAAAAGLYGARMQRQQLGKLQRRADQKAILPTLANAEQIDSLRASIKKLEEQINQLQQQLQSIEGLLEQFNILTELGQQLEQEIAVLQQQIEGIRNELENAELTKEQRLLLEDRLAVLQEQVAEINIRLGSLSGELATLRQQLSERPEPKELQAALREAEARKAALQKELDSLIRRGTRQAEDQGKALEQTRAEMEKHRAGLSQSSLVLSRALAELFKAQGPETLIGEWDDSLPILLQPVRLETRFSNGDNKELWVRIFPDDFAVVTHEQELTAIEISYGTAHWKALWQAGAEADLKKTAWVMLTTKFGNNRAAWVARSTRPLNWQDRDQLADTEGLVFPEFDITKDNSWTRAPHTRILPDCFVLLCYRQGALVHSQTGKLIDDILTLGPEPPVDDEPATLDRDEQNRIIVDEPLAWMVDFDKAVEKGMDLRIPLDETAALRGFDQMIAVGLKLSADPEDSRQLLQDLLENHRYSRAGFELIRQGTPTNNTEAEDAGYSRQQGPEELAAFIENDQVWFTPVSDPREATDGQRMAEMLGIDYELLQIIPNSQLKDHREAVAMNTALYAGTLGYYLQAMLQDVLDVPGLKALRTHFTEMVTGRGPLAGFRVGHQPYGLLLTSDFSKWTYGRVNRSDVSQPFYRQLNQVLRVFESSWQQKTGTLSHITKSGNAGQQLLDILGLHPNSVDFAQRVGYSWDSLKNLEAFGWGGKYFSDVWASAVEAMQTRSLLTSLGYQANDSNGNPKTLPMLLQLVFRHYSSRLGNHNLIDGQPFSEADTIKAYDAAGEKNYIHWLLEHADDADALEKQDFGQGVVRPNALLYLLLRYSQLHESSQAIYEFLKVHDISAREIVQSRKFMNISPTPSVSHWEVFQAPVHQLIPAENSSQPLLKHIYQLPVSSNLGENLAAHSWALSVLRDMPTARLERTLVEHMDCLSYRLDAWQTSLFEQRLQSLRTSNDDNGRRVHRRGIYLGAYGYLENVRPGQQRTKIAEDILPEALREQKDNLYRDPANGGYIHAPTLNHATAAAILRNGYLTHASAAEKEKLAVNLSSERVRRAQVLLEGIQNGQTLEALLGYQFERGLHDFTTRKPDPIILNHLIPYFRLAFPMKKTKIPQLGNTTGPEEIAKDYHVVNGLDLAATTTPFPYGIPDLPALSQNQIQAIEQEREGIINSLDALRDLLTAETAYQLALGNFERAAGVMQAISGTSIVPQPEIIGSGKGTALSFTNKVILNLQSGVSGNPWPGCPMTRKAMMEPSLNQWLATLLGSPDKIRCRVMAVDAEGQVLTRPDATPISSWISLQELQLQAIDIIYLVQKTSETSGSSELETRIRYWFAQQEHINDDTVVKIEFGDAGSSDLAFKSFAEILPFADLLRQLLGNSRPVSAKDYEPATRELVRPADNPEQLNLPDLHSRCASLYDYFELQMTGLSSAVTDARNLQTPVTTEQLRSSLKSIADAGLVFAFPQSVYGTDPAALEILLTQGDSVSARWTVIQEAYQQTLLQLGQPATTIAIGIRLLSQAIEQLFGTDFKVLPRYDFNNTADIIAAYSSSDSLLDYCRATAPLPVIEWLHGIALVRPNMHTLESIRLLHEGFNDQELELAPLQLPYREQDNWLAMPYPSGTEVLDDTLAILQLNPQGFDPAGSQCGLLLDAWPETIPNKEEITGISFNYNQPNAVPPQALLLTVSPELTGKWKWDNLVGSIRDSFARARRRAVEPDHIDQMPGISTLLPATLTEFSTLKTGISLDYEWISDSVFKEVIQLMDLNPTN